MRPSERLTLKSKDLAPPLVARLPFWSIVIAASETGVSTKTGIRDGSDLVALMGQQALAPAAVWKSGRADLEFRSPCSIKIVQDCTKYVTKVPGSIVCGVSCKNQVSGELTAAAQDTTRALAWRPTTTLAPRPLRNKMETLTHRAEVLLTKQLQVQRCANA